MNNKEFFMNGGIPPQQQLQYDQQFISTMPTWQSLANSIEIQTNQSQDYESALSSMVSSPVASNSALSTDNFMIRELIGNSIVLSSNLPAMPGDPGFAERAARFSSFGSRSFNGRTSTNQFNNNGELVHRLCSNLGGVNSKIQRVSSSPLLKEAHGAQVVNNNSINERNKQSRNSSVSGQNQAAENGSNRKRKASVRREKISERMKLLQDLVPGCNRVTGKALMLDEIINYVQSLQRQVEFLSMKLSTVNPRLEVNMNNLFTKDGIQPNCTLTHPMYPTMVPTQYGQPHQNPLRDCIPTIGATTVPCPMDPLNPTLNHNHSSHLSSIHAFSNCLPQLPSLCEGDLQSIVQMGFLQMDDGFQTQTSQGTNPTQMKIEL
ncbi:hypothetical protein KSS87_005623 [Heliosperma pusillum]|nr:hypothetical protein KSS87_005623 [Heliosperma pusillum]